MFRECDFYSLVDSQYREKNINIIAVVIIILLLFFFMLEIIYHLKNELLIECFKLTPNLSAI